MRAMYDNGGDSFSVELLSSEEARAFISEHASLLDSSYQSVDMSDRLRVRLNNSDHIFSGLKAFHEMNEAFPKLLDENGNRKPFEQFLSEVRAIDSTYNRNYLQAEYNYAHDSATMAARWEEYAEDGDRYNLQYRTAGDGKVRPEHVALNGVTLPLSDPFWDSYYPPNGWNCRCSAIRVRKSKYPVTPHDEAIARGEEALRGDKKGMFRTNAGKTQKTFPDYNPYTIRRCNDCDIAQGKAKLAKSAPDNQLCEACKHLRCDAENNRSSIFVARKKELEKSAEKLQCASENLATGELYQTRKSFKRGISHARNIEEAEMYSIINSHISELSYVRESPLGEGKDKTNPRDIANLEKKRNRGVTGYRIYTLEHNGIVWKVKTEVYRNKSEAIYHLHKTK